MNWRPHLCHEEIDNRRGTRFVRHWIFGILVWDTYPSNHKIND